MQLEKLSRHSTSWEDRYRVIIDAGKKLLPMPANLKTEENRVTGCMNTLHLCVLNRNPLNFIAQSDSVIVNGLIAILQTVYAGKTQKAISEIDISTIFAQLGLETHLSMNRRNGFFSMVEKLRK